MSFGGILDEQERADVRGYPGDGAAEALMDAAVIFQRV